VIGKQMILGIMQPYFFPYAGYFQLILAVDHWIAFDIVQYRRKSWMNRNRVLHPNQNWQYVSIPVHAQRDSLINEATIVDPQAAQQRTLGQLEHYRGNAPYFSQVRELVTETFSAIRTNLICDLNMRSLVVVCAYLGISFNWSLCSEMAIGLPAVEYPGQWALEISSAMGAQRYINLPGGRDIFRRAEWDDRGVELRFLNPAPFHYATGPYAFQEDLSILDVLMWNDPSTISKYLIETLNVSE
jgi:hypothetical protein